jgi:hypothetical protein
MIPLAMEWLWAGAGCACLCAAAAAALKPGWRSAVENPSPELSRRLEKAALPIFGALFPIACAAFKLAQFHRRELLFDSAITGNLLWSLAHGGGFRSSLCGASYLSVHFCLNYILAAPLALLPGGMAPLAFLQGLSVGFSPLAAYLLGRKASSDPVSGWGLALLTASTGFFHDLAGAPVTHAVAEAPLALWCAVLWEAGRTRLACAAAALLLANSEASGLLLAGFGLALLRSRESRRAGALLCAVSIAAWLGQLAVMRHALDGLPPVWNTWPLFVPLGSSPGELARRALTSPWDFALALVRPPGKLWTLVRTLGAFAFLPAASGTALAPALVMWLPHQLANAGTTFHKLIGNECAYLFGPLVWASARGWARLRERFSPRWLLLAAVLLASGAGFLQSARFLLEPRAVPAYWDSAVPKAAAFIPPGAALWCDEMLSPEFAFRRDIKALSRGENPFFTRGLFVPDRVLLSLEWIRLAEPAFRDRILGGLRERGFAEVFRERDLVVLAPARRH